MAKALLILSDGSKRLIEADKAVRYWHILQGHVEDISEQEAQAVMYIRDIRIGRDHQPQGYTSAISNPMQTTPILLDVRPVDDINSRRVEQASLYHEGIEQGMNQALPSGDR